MSGTKGDNDPPMQCAACGKTAKSGILKRCTACYSVRYCNVTCQKSHLKAHANECRRIGKDRAFEAALLELDLSEENVASPPPRPECPLCMHGMPPSTGNSIYMACCSQVICRACYVCSLDFVDTRSDLDKRAKSPNKKGLSKMMTTAENFEKKCDETSCPFCRSKNIIACTMPARVKLRERLEGKAQKDDPRALFELGKLCLNGERMTLDQKVDFIYANMIDKATIDETRALECFQKAASLGNCDAYYELAQLHHKNREATDYLVCLQKAADLGNMDAHRVIAELAMKRENSEELAMAHYKVLAVAGCADSIDKLVAGYKDGCVTKDDLAASLRAHQSAREEFASDDRVYFSNIAAQKSSDGKIVPSSLFM